MIIRPINTNVIEILDFQILNLLRKEAICDFWEIHNLQQRYKQAPFEVLSKIIEILTELQKHRM